MSLTILLPEEAELLAAAKLAQAQHLHLISNGQRAVLSPTIPAGWHRVCVTSKEVARHDHA
ncbi:hypothetical protein [Methylobacillus flagellatus]|uniref:hypothetical protein n=1 Tax=Methylobacillus flagellatus TaxID=405 RepID=UPI0010FA259C|nr:hypothetical protein [Methylobacillus flagellatus]